MGQRYFSALLSPAPVATNLTFSVKVKDMVFSDSQALRRSRAPPGEATPYAVLEPERGFGTTGFLDAA
jgi:hypothetical protein